MRHPHLTDDDPDYVAIYSACALWALLFAVLTPSTLDLGVLRIVNVALMAVTCASSISCLYGVITHDRLGPERLALWGVMAGFVVYAITQLVLAFAVYIPAGNTDRVALSVYALLPVLFLNRRRRFLVKRRRAVTVVREMHEKRTRS